MIEAQVDKPLDSCPTGTCSSGETCCMVGDGKFGCCPYPNADCCSDHSHCCPSGFICDVKKGECVKSALALSRSKIVLFHILYYFFYFVFPYFDSQCEFRLKILFLRKLETLAHPGLAQALKHAAISEMDNMVLFHYAFCLHIFVRLFTDFVGCCPYPNANCCSDHAHCCPQQYQCDVNKHQCVHSPADGLGLRGTIKFSNLVKKNI